MGIGWIINVFKRCAVIECIGEKIRILVECYVAESVAFSECGTVNVGAAVESDRPELFAPTECGRIKSDILREVKFRKAGVRA